MGAEPNGTQLPSSLDEGKMSKMGEEPNGTQLPSSLDEELFCQKY